jgi:glycosyltransferase involved in cell wall biosynthesis
MPVTSLDTSLCYEPGVSDARVTVAVDVTPLLGARTGVGYAVAEVVEALRAREAAPTIVPYTLSARARLLRDRVAPDTRFVPLPARFLVAAWARTDAPRIDRWLRPADVVHATNFLAPPSAMPTLVTIHDCSFVRYPELCRPEVRALEPIVRRTIARGATVHTPSEFVAHEVEDVFAKELRGEHRVLAIPWGLPPVAPSGVMPLELAARLGDKAFVLAVGTLEPRKNYTTLVRAFASVAATDPNVMLVIAGHDDTDRVAIDDAIARLAPDTRMRIVLAGPVSDSAKRALLDAATMLVYPSVYEGFGFPLLEAMSVGIPVIASEAGSIPEVANDAAVLFAADDVDALASGIERLLTDDTLRAELVRRGHKRADEFSWASTAKELADCYERLAGRS